MKTIFKDNEILRESNSDAEFKIKHQRYKYCSKSKWKEQVRDIKKPITQIILDEIKDLTKEKRKEKHKKIKERQRKL